MGNMYNLVHGENPLAVILLACVHIMREAFGRYRDTFLSADGTKVIVLARIGGGNRQDHREIWTGLRRHPNYINDRDDEYDSTYAWITFKVDEDYLPNVKPLATGKEPPSMREMTEEVLNNPQRVMQLQKDQRVRALMTKIVEAVKERLSPKEGE